MELHEELGAISAIFGDVVEVLDSSSCNVKLESLVVNVVWSSSSLPRFALSDNSFESVVALELQAANIGDPIVFEVLEKLKSAIEQRAIEEQKKTETTVSAVVSTTQPRKEKGKGQKPKSKKNPGEKRSDGGGGGVGRGGGVKSETARGDHRQQQQKKAPEKKTSSPYVPGAIFSGEQESRLVALLRLDEADMPAISAKPMASIVSGSSDARTKTRLLKCYDKLEAAGLDHETIVMGMSALVGGSFDAIVDWLLLHVPRDKLPLSLGGEVKSQEVTEASVSKKVETAKKKDDLREYEFGTWTGKFPKSLLHEFAQKKGCSKPAYNRAKHKGAEGLRFKVSMNVESNKLAEFKKGSVIEVECPEACKDEMQAQNLAATYCLFSLNKNLSLHTLLPPSYRAAWERWLKDEKEQKLESKETKEKPKREFLDMLFGKIHDMRASLGTVQTVSLPIKNDSVAASFVERKFESRDGGKAVRQASAALKSWFLDRQKDAKYQKMMQARSKLPVFAFRDDILKLIRANQVVCISGETGCGKSTQIPQFLLESMLMSDLASETHIVCTQPRRISAQSIAARVAEEMAEEVGGIVGYKVRLDSRVSRRTQLTYCTTGVLLRRLQSDPFLSGTTHLIVDEVHERSLESDFLLVLLLDLLTNRRNQSGPKDGDLKLILMSATADANLFSRYFFNAPIVSVPGRTFPCDVFYVEDVVKMTGYRIDDDSEFAVEDSYEVREIDVEISGKSGERNLERLEYETKKFSNDAKFLDEKVYDMGVRRTVATMNHNCINHDLIEEILMMIEEKEPFCSQHGAVLIFLPSFAEISALFSRCQQSSIFGNENTFVLVMLHGTLSGEEQKKAFRAAPKGMRKIIFASNIAETGVTISDVLFVIDSGFENSARRDGGVFALRTHRIARSSAVQRAGRAGRVQPGFVFRLFSRRCFEEEMELEKSAEISRAPLAQICLQMLDMNLSPLRLLSRCITPPPPKSVESAMAVLQQTGATMSASGGFEDSGGLLTGLGRAMARVATEPHLSRMLLFAALLRCLRPAALLAAAAAAQSPFHRPVGRESEADRKKREFAVKGSDHFALVKLVNQWQSVGRARQRDWCRANFVDNQRLETIHKSAQDLEKTVRSLFANSDSVNFDENSNCAAVLHVALCAGMFPQIAVLDSDNILRYGPKQKKVLVHPSSCNARVSLPSPSYLLYQEVFKSAQGKVYLKETSVVGVVPLLLFSLSCSLNVENNTATLDNSIVVKASARSVAIIRKFAVHFNRLLENPDVSVFSNPILKEFENILKEKK